MDWQPQTERLAASLQLLLASLAKRALAKSFTLFPLLCLPSTPPSAVARFSADTFLPLGIHLRQFVFSPLHRLCLSLSSNLFPPFPSASFLHPSSSSCCYCTSICMCESVTCLRCLGSAAQHSGKLNGTAASLVSLSLVSLSICASEESGAFCPSAPEEIMRCQRRVTAPPLNSECKNPLKIVARGRRGLRDSFHLVLGVRGERSRPILSSMPLRSASGEAVCPPTLLFLSELFPPPGSTLHCSRAPTGAITSAAIAHECPCVFVIR